MSAIGLKSISGITSITTPAGVDDQLTLHTNNTTERLKIDVAGNVHVNNQLAVTGVTTFSGDVDVDGHTNLDNVNIAGVTSCANSIHLNQAVPEIRFNSTTHENDFKIINYQGNFIVQDIDALANRFEIASNGTVNFLNNVNANGGLDVTGNTTVTGDIDVDGHTNLDNVNIAGVTTSAGNIYADNYFGNSGLTLNNNGNPSVNLTSTSTGGSSRINFGDPDSTTVGKIYYNHSIDYMYFATAYAERVRITSAGRLGIGENSPDAMLHVTGSDNVLGLFESTDADSLIQFKDNSTSDTILMGALGGDDLLLRCDAGNIVFHVANNNEKLRITSDGKMGLGITNPTGKFAVSDGTRIAEINPHSSGTFIGNRSNHPVLFQVNASEKVRITSSGDMGIGTNSPDRRLDVSGTGNVYGKFQSTNATGAGIELKDTGQNWLIQADNGGSQSSLAFYDLANTSYRVHMKDNGNVEIVNGNLVVASGHGIDFSANGNASGMTSELLDIYEEGTWTPYIYPMSSSIPVTYSHQSGKYTRIGNVVHFQFKLQVSNITGNRNQGFGINGFPFNNTNSQAQINGEFYGETWDGEMPTTIKWIGNTNRGVCYFYNSSNDYQSSSMLDINVSSSMLMGAGHYFTH